MSQFNTEDKKHETFSLLFDSYKVKASFKATSQARYWVVKDKEEERITSMLKTLDDIAHSSSQHFKSAISAIAFARSQEEAVLMQLGVLCVEANGVAICPNCLAKTILLVEENLGILKDLQKATQRYASVNT